MMKGDEGARPADGKDGADDGGTFGPFPFFERRSAWGSTTWLLFAFLYLIAFGLRIYRLDGFELWGDEAWSVMVARWPVANILSSGAEVNPPLYNLLLHLMIRLAGHSPFAIRFLSVTLSQLALGFVVLLGKALGNRKLGLWALAAGAVSPFLVYYAHDARMYGPALLGAAGSLASFALMMRDQALKREVKRRHWFVYVISSLIGVYSHYYAFSILLAEALLVAARFAQHRLVSRLRPWLSAWLLMGLLFLPWPLIQAQFLGGRVYSRFDQWSLTALLEIVRRTQTAYGAGITLGSGQAWQGWLVAAMAALGLLALFRYKGGRPAGWLAVTVLMAGYLFAWGIAPFMPFFYERYLLIGMPAFLITLAAAFMWLYSVWRPAALLAVLGVLMISAGSLRNQFYSPAYDKGGYGRLMADIERQAKQGDLILLNNTQQEPLFDYYGTAKIPSYFLDWEMLQSEHASSSWLEATTAGMGRVWLVETGNAEGFDPQHRAQTWLGQQGSRGFYHNFGNGNILHLFVLPPQGDSEFVRTHAVLGDEIQLTGFSFQPDIIQPGQTLLVTLEWEAIAALDVNYTVFIHLIDEGGVLRAQIDGQPVGGVSPTSTWVPDEIIEDRHAVLLPDDLLPGSYTVRVGMYLWPELTRLPVLESDGQVVENSITLGTVVSP